MKAIIFFLLGFSLTNVMVTDAGFGNPFSCKIKVQTPPKKEKPLEVLYYKGYAQMDNQQFAFVQMGKKQFALKAGDRIGNLQILKIFDDFLVYEINNQVFETSIEKVPVNERSKIRPDQTADDAEKLDDSNP